MFYQKNEKAKLIRQCLQLAILLEVSTYKPGNVTFTKSFHKTRAEHFLSSAVAAGPFFEEAAMRGIAINDGNLALNKAGLGVLIKNCIFSINSWQKGGNTILGTIILFMPLALSAGMTPLNGCSFNLTQLRINLKNLVESTSALDSVYLYEAIDAANPSGLKNVASFDVTDPLSKKKLLSDNISLYKVFTFGSSYDDICSEWVNNYCITFDEAYSYLDHLLSKNKDLKIAIVHTFLKVLSLHPDTLISRKVSLEKAKEISFNAANILKSNGLETEKGKKLLEDLDLKLRSNGNLLNPGTTADITATALALILLKGFRP